MNSIIDNTVQEHKHTKEEISTSKEEIINYLQPKDFDYIDDIYSLERRFGFILKILDSNKRESAKRQLHKYSLTDLYNNVHTKLGEMHNVANLVDSTYRDKSITDIKIIEQRCYLEKLMQAWRMISGDGNCFYRAVMIGYVENLILNKDVMQLKWLMVELYKSLQNKTFNDKRIENSLKTLLMNINLEIVMSILYAIYDEVDNNNIIHALDFFIKSLNVSTSFDKVFKH